MYCDVSRYIDISMYRDSECPDSNASIANPTIDNNCDSFDNYQ